MRNFYKRSLPRQPIRNAVIAGMGGMIAIAAIGAFTAFAHAPLIMAPFGATCVLLFSVPASPLSQPMNVIGGHVVATIVGLLLRMVLPNEWWAVALAVGVAIALMSALRVTHPPAGADPLVVFAIHPGLEFAVLPVLLGAVSLVLVATMYHRLLGAEYPTRKN